MFLDKSKIDPIGFVVVEEVNKHGLIVKSHKQNLVVNNARVILRDQLHTPSDQLRLNILQLGDMYLTYGDDTSNLTPPNAAEVSLIHSVFSKNASTRDKVTESLRPSLKLGFVISETEANDPNPSISNKLFTEFGLFTSSNLMFARAVLPVVKTRDIGLNIYWTIII